MFRSTPKNDSDIDEEEQDEAISPAEKLRRFSTSDAEEKHSLRRRTRLGRSRTGDVQPVASQDRTFDSDFSNGKRYIGSAAATRVKALGRTIRLA
ncbi:hypothetical protein H0H92_003517 [Tricholoma furcatifolium]|nr:hypothetical protein H0H92_003517 [Tricholoma furcatifolium]